MNKTVYNEYLNSICKIPRFLNKYLEVPCLVRLKNIGYFCGMDYASKEVYDFREEISRFDHSLTVALLTWKFTHDKKATIAGLFHDVATPCFAHVIDYMNKDYANQESTEEYTEEIIKNDKELRRCLRIDKMTYKDICNFKEYSIVDNKRPRLCADRFDGLILTGYNWTKSIELNDILDFTNNLCLYTNEDNVLELGFRDKDICTRVLKLSEEIDEICHSNEDNFMMELLADITRTTINNNIIKYNDLYYLTEIELFDKIKNSEDNNLLNLLDLFYNMKVSEIPDTSMIDVKKRDLNPLCYDGRIKNIC